MEKVQFPAISDGAQPVFYGEKDYAGFGRRMVVSLSDGFVTIASFILIAVIIASIKLPSPTHEALALTLISVFLGSYFIILKKTKFGTLGYWLAGVRLVDVYGRAPGFWQLVGRSVYGVFGLASFPPFLLGDIYFIYLDKYRQTFRDRLAHTYLIRSNARPAGFARIIHRPWQIGGGSFVFQGLQEIATEAISGNREAHVKSAVILRQFPNPIAQPAGASPVEIKSVEPFFKPSPTAKSTPPPPPPPPPRPLVDVPPPLPRAKAKDLGFDPSVMECLERLGDLRDRGVLTNQEFEQEKQKVLRSEGSR